MSKKLNNLIKLVTVLFAIVAFGYIIPTPVYAQSFSYPRLFDWSVGPHSDGNNVLYCDGHSKWHPVEDMFANKKDIFSHTRK